MGEVRAFVGHSFTDDDKDVVGKFTDLLDTLKKLNLSFSWVHARAAEPKQLTEKVLALIQDCNLFIAICTKKERVVSTSQPTQLFKRFVLKPDDVQWKTSDWVIQEIGLAIGRNMQLILLIEDGVRKPGGLQGDVEYIPFTREAPEKAFNRIAEMVTALGLNQGPTTGSAVVSNTAPAAPAEAEASADGLITAEATWGEDDFDLAQFRCILRDGTSPENIRETYIKLPGAPTETRLGIWQARNECYRLLLSKGGDLDALRELAENHPTNGAIAHLYAQALDRFKKYDQAGEFFEKAANLMSTEFDGAESLARAALAYERSGATEKVRSILKELRARASVDKRMAKGLYATLQGLAEFQEDKYLAVAAQEGHIDRSPAAFRERFSLAYLHSELGNEDLALHHYLQIPSQERQSLDWNNLGASYSHFKIVGKAVSAYRKSEEMAETLAMSNLGFLLLHAGFTDEAQAICTKALQVPNFHKNVGHLSVAIKDQAENEEKAVSSTLDEAKTRIAFYSAFGIALADPELRRIAGTWVGPECEMTLERDGDQVALRGNYQRQQNPLSAALGLAGSNVLIRHEVHYSGVLRGRTVIGYVKRKSDEKSLSLVASSSDPQKFLMVISEQEILILDVSSSNAQPITFAKKEMPLQLEAS